METCCCSPRMRWPPGCLNGDRKSTRLNSSHDQISYAVFCLKKKNKHAQFRSTRNSKRLQSRPDEKTHHVGWLKEPHTRVEVRQWDGVASEIDGLMETHDTE